ncbi:hypothetical protein BDZ97DRAFT_1928510 [Flammula alnicola]|nr:hypothetical protein BDZ97DRAFT_1928510 [Flammula alnicola]
MGYKSASINILNKAALYALIARQSDVEWPERRFGPLNPPRTPTIDILRKVLRGDYGYHPSDEDDPLPPNSTESNPSDEGGVNAEESHPKDDNRLPPNAMESSPTEEAGGDTDPVAANVVLHDGLAHIECPSTSQEAVAEAMPVRTAGRSISPRSPSPDPSQFGPTEAPDIDKFLPWSPSSYPSDSESEEAEPKSRALAQLDSGLEADPSPPNIFASDAIRKSYHMRLLQEFVEENVEWSTRLTAFTEQKHRNLGTAGSQILIWEVGITLEDVLRKKNNWKGTVVKIPVKTIHEFLRRAPSWFSQARPAVLMAQLLGPQSSNPDTAVVDFLQQSATAAQIFKFSSTYIEKGKNGICTLRPRST